MSTSSIITLISLSIKVTAVAKSLVSRWIMNYVRPIQIIGALIVIIGGLYLIVFNARAFIFTGLG